MKDLNNVHFAILDHKDQYYTIEQTKPYIKLEIEHVRMTYNKTGDEGLYKETK